MKFGEIWSSFVKFAKFHQISPKIEKIVLCAPRARNRPVAAGRVLFSRFGEIVGKMMEINIKYELSCSKHEN